MKCAGRRNTLAILLAVSVLTVSFPFTVNATTTKEKLDQAKEQKKVTESAIDATKKNISGMQGEKNSLQGQLGLLNGNLQKVSDKLGELEEKISDKKDEISTTQKALEKAKKTEEIQYENMKKRNHFEKIKLVSLSYCKS